MRRTFCDRCGDECTSSIGHLNLNVEHYTNTREQVGDDEYGTPDLCWACVEALRIWFKAAGKEWPTMQYPKEAMALEAPPALAVRTGPDSELQIAPGTVTVNVE